MKHANTHKASARRVRRPSRRPSEQVLIAVIAALSLVAAAWVANDQPSYPSEKQCSLEIWV